MHPEWFRIGGVAADLPKGWEKMFRDFLSYLPPRLIEYDHAVMQNRIFKGRTQGVGRYTADEAIEWGVTGPNLRACGFAWDFRKRQPYSGYEQFEFEIPTALEQFVECDDGALWQALRRSSNGWARRIVARRPYKLLAQFTERDEGYDLKALTAALLQAQVEHFALESEGVLSKYFQEGVSGPSLFIRDTSTGRLTEVAKYTPLYQRYSSAVRLTRIYVLPEQVAAARGVLSRVAG